MEEGEGGATVVLRRKRPLGEERGEGGVDSIMMMMKKTMHSR